MLKSKEYVFFNLLLLLISLLFCFIIIEIGFRIFWQHSDSFYKSDPYIGQIHIPGKSGKWLGKEFSNEISINQHGFVGKDYEYAKPANTERAIILGDSFVEAMQVPIDKNFSALTESYLPTLSTSSSNYEILNLGVSNFGTGRAYFNYKQYGQQYDPDAVVYAFYLGNDLSDSYMEEEEDPSFVKGESSGLKKKLKSFLLNNLETVKYIRNKSYTSVKLRQLLTQIGVFSESKSTVLNQDKKQLPFKFHKYLPEDTEFYKKAWEKTDMYFNSLREAIGDKNFMVMIIPAREQMYLEYWDEMKESYPELQDEEVNLEKPYNDLLTYLEEKQIKYLDLYPIFKTIEPSEENRLYFKYDGHFTPYGHEITARALSEYMLKNKILE